MITASEARKRAENNITTTELTEIMKQIENAIADGKFFISKVGCLKSGTRKKLEELGYKVVTGRQYNESYYSIRW